MNERLRYGPLKAGYHGGASPAETVVPLVLLAPAGLDHHLTAAPIAEPDWWTDATTAGAAAAASGTVLTPAPAAVPEAPQPDLFTEPAPVPAGGPGMGASLLGSATYKAQKTLVGRLGVTDPAIAGLIDALASAPDRRLPAGRIAALLGVPANRVGMVMSQVAKLLNVEGYPVVSTDPATQAVTLDAALLAEQYGVTEGQV